MQNENELSNVLTIMMNTNKKAIASAVSDFVECKWIINLFALIATMFGFIALSFALVISLIWKLVLTGIKCIKNINKVEDIKDYEYHQQ